MFWHGHVRWRTLRGPGDKISHFLTLLLVLLTLIYVQPLRSMAAASGLWFTGQGTGFSGFDPLRGIGRHGLCDLADHDLFAGRFDWTGARVKGGEAKEA